MYVSYILNDIRYLFKFPTAFKIEKEALLIKVKFVECISDTKLCSENLKYPNIEQPIFRKLPIMNIQKMK